MMIPHQNRHYKGGLLLCGIVNIDPVRTEPVYRLSARRDTQLQKDVSQEVYG